MGNNHGYSKGCRTCVKRRIKCDERRPICMRCEKRGISCAGFKDAIFVDVREQVMRRFACESENVSSNSTRSGTSSTEAFSCQLNDAASLESSGFSSRQIMQSSSQLFNDMPMSPHISPLRDEIYVLYTIRHLCKGPSAMMYCNVLPCNPSGLHPHQSMMNQCLLALAKVFYGFHNRESRVAQDGMRLYGLGLSTLSEVLSKSNCNITTEIIISVFALSIGESIMPTGKFSWMIHLLGLERLFALQGPLLSENRTMLDSLVLDSCRPLLILIAFFTQRPSLMGKPEWKAITSPPQDSNANFHGLQTSKEVSDLSFLMGVLAELPELFLQCDKCIQLAKATEPSPDTHVNMIWSRVKQLRQDLQAWKKKWNDHHQNEIWVTSTATPIGSTQDLGRTTVLQFSSVQLAITFTMYHTVLILLTSISTSLLKADLGFPSATSTTISDHDGALSLSQSASNVRLSVRNICRSMQYILQSLQPSQAPADFYIFFPIHVARRASNQLGYTSELAWLVDAFEVMRSKYPMGLWVNLDLANRFNGLQEGLFG